MAKKLEIIGKTAKFQMSIKGAKLPDNFESFIQVEMSFADAQFEDMVRCCASGQSARVALQAQLRAKTVEELRGMEKNGLKVSFNDIIAGKVSRPIDRIMALSLDDFVELMVFEFEMDEDQAVALYNKKHGIVEDDEVDDPNE